MEGLEGEKKPTGNTARCPDRQEGKYWDDIGSRCRDLTGLEEQNKSEEYRPARQPFWMDVGCVCRETSVEH